MTRSRRSTTWVALGAGALLCAGHGRAVAQSAADKAAADTLFSEGKKLIASGDTEAACAKFEASLSRVTQLGAQLALASCYEKLGKTASAWGEFRTAASAAGKARDPQRKRFADDHAAALEPRLSRVVIKLEPGYRVDNLEVKRDGLEVSTAELGTPVPVDPGEHTVEASAPGWVAWSTKVTVAGMPGTVEVIVPALGKAPVKVEEPRPEPVPVPAPVRLVDDQHDRRTIAYAVGGGGAAMVGVSLIFGALARSKWSDAHAHCRGNVCDQAGLDLTSGAGTMGNVSTATFLLGGAALAAGAYLWFTARPSGEATQPPATALRLVPGLGPAQVGLTLQGGF